DATVNTTLTLTTGNITTGPNMVSVPLTGGSVSRTSGHVVGNLLKFVNKALSSTQTFEVGTGSTYAPINVVITATAHASGTLVGTTAVGDHPNISTSGINSARSVNRYWTLTLPASGALDMSSGGLLSATFNFIAGDVDAGSDTSAFFVKRFTSPSTWSSTTAGTRTTTSTQATGLAAFGDFAVGDPTGTATTTLLSASPTTACASQSITFIAG